MRSTCIHIPYINKVPVHAGPAPALWKREAGCPVMAEAQFDEGETHELIIVTRYVCT